MTNAPSTVRTRGSRRRVATPALGIVSVVVVMRATSYQRADLNLRLTADIRVKAGRRRIASTIRYAPPPRPDAGWGFRRSSAIRLFGDWAPPQSTGLTRPRDRARQCGASAARGRALVPAGA